jgi:hypothetical protein
LKSQQVLNLLTQQALENYNPVKNGLWILAHLQMPNVLSVVGMQNNPYPVYPEDDGRDRFRNPYSPV